MEKWGKNCIGNRGGEVVGKLVGKMGKVGGKGEFCTGGVGAKEICTGICTRFTRGFSRRFAQVFHRNGVLVGVGWGNWRFWVRKMGGISHRFSPGFLRFGRGGRS